jgi:hypothetical protein
MANLILSWKHLLRRNGAVLKRRLPSWRRTGQPLRILLKSENRRMRLQKELGSGAPTEPDGSLLTLRAAVSEVHLVFTVTDKHDHYIKDLKQNDFKILDDHKPPQQILQLPERNGSSPASRPADRYQPIGARSLYVRAGSGHRVSEADPPAEI